MPGPGLFRCVDPLYEPLVSSGVEADVEVIAPTADGVAEIDRLSGTLRMDEVRFGYLIPAVFPSKRSQEGVRGPAAVDHERINGFSNLLEHVRTQKEVYEFKALSSTPQNGVEGVNSLRSAHTHLFPPNEVKLGQSGDAIDARIHLQTKLPR